MAALWQSGSLKRMRLELILALRQAAGEGALAGEAAELGLKRHRAPRRRRASELAPPQEPGS